MCNSSKEKFSSLPLSTQLNSALDILETHHAIALTDSNYEQHRHYDATINAIDTIKNIIDNPEIMHYKTKNADNRNIYEWIDKIVHETINADLDGWFYAESPSTTQNDIRISNMEAVIRSLERHIKILKTGVSNEQSR